MGEKNRQGHIHLLGSPNPPQWVPSQNPRESKGKCGQIFKILVEYLTILKEGNKSPRKLSERNKLLRNDFFHISHLDKRENSSIPDKSYRKK